MEPSNLNIFPPKLSGGNPILETKASKNVDQPIILQIMEEKFIKL